MAYDRYDTRDRSRDPQSRWSGDDDRSAGGRQDNRGFFERAGDEVASWFGDEDAERRRRQDYRREEHRDRDYQPRGQDRDYDRGYGRDYDRDRNRMSSDRDDDRSRMSGQRDRNRDWNDNRGTFSSGGSSDRDYNPSWRNEYRGGDRDYGRDFDRERDRNYRPMTGDYGRGQAGYLSSGGEYGRERGRDEERSREGPWASDQYRRTSSAGASRRSGDHDRYQSWRQRHMDELDRDYDDYRRENQSKFESDFGGWRNQRESKRRMLDQVRDHMEVVGNDDKHVGTVDYVRGDRIVLTKDDPDSGGMHHSLSCSDIECIRDGKVVLDCSADQAHKRWRDENRNRALFEREDQGQGGPHVLNRSFEGTYR